MAQMAARGLSARACVLLALLSLAAGARAQRRQVAIIGAGISGIRAASVLADAGVDSFVVLEATDRIGGRMRNAEMLPYGSNRAPGISLELGANWIQGLTGNPIYDLAMSPDCGGLSATPQNWDDVITFDEYGRPLPDSQIPWRKFDNAEKCVASTIKADVLAGRYPEPDTRAALRLCGWDPVKPIDYAVEWFSENYEWAEMPEMIGITRTHPNNAYVDFQDADLFAHQQTEGGIAKLVTCLARRSNVTGRVRLNARATQFKVSGRDTVLVKTSTGATWEVDYVINTMPIAVLQRNLDTLFPDAGLWPAAKRAALMQFRLATYTKIFLQFDSQFWDRSSQFILQAPNAGSSFMVLWQSLSPAAGFLQGSNVIMMTTTDVVSASMESLSDQIILERAVQRLQQIYPAANTTSKLVGYLIPRWYTNENFGGSFTNWPAGMTEASFDLMREPVGTPGALSVPGKVLMAGEAACKRLNGYMPGAYAAGERAANQVLAALNRFNGDVNANLCERQLTANGKPLGTKARGAGRGGVRR